MATLQERKELLYNDPDLSVVEPHRVFCKRCDKWLKLDEVKLYAASVWRCHKNTKSHNARPPASDGPSPAPAPPQESGGKSGRRGVKSSTKSLASALQSRRSGTNTPAASPSEPAPRSQTRLTIKIPSSLQKDHSAESPSTSPLDDSNSAPKSPVYNHPLKKSVQYHGISKDLRGLSPGVLSDDSSRPTVRLAPTLGMSPSQVKETEGTSASDAAFPYPDNISPHRKASYKALLTEPFVGRLEPFRAYCTLCARWVPLSSRTPYSHGVWKGHVKNSEKHNATMRNMREEIGSSNDRSPDRNGSRKTLSTLKLNKQTGMISDQRLNSIHVESTPGGRESTRNDETDPMEVDAMSNPNPFALKAATENGFAPYSETVEPKDGLLQGDIPNLTESSDDEPFAKQTPQKKASLIALERRRQTIVLDPDAAIVEPRKVKCGICERWIKGSNTQEYSLHHWHKHKKKCLRNKKALLADKSELIEARKALLEADPDLTAIEPHRVFCNICKKWVKLCGRSRYSASHWFQHKKLCFIAQSGVLATSSSQTAVTTTHERRLALEADTDAMTVWPGRIQCHHCHQLVSIPFSPSFMPASWIAHKAECFKANDIISKKLEKAPGIREEILAADCLITNVTPLFFYCKVCNTTVEMDMSLPYSLNQWDAHKKICGMPNKRLKKDDVAPNDDDQSRTGMNGVTTRSTDETPETKMDIPTEANPEPSIIAPNKTEEEDIKMVDEDPAALPFQNEETLDQVTKIRTSEDRNGANARLEYFLAQHDVFKIEPHRALCGGCLTWITLGSDAFNVQKWEAHKSVCRGPKSYKASEESQKTEIYGVNSLKQTLANRSNLKSLSSLPKKRLKSTAEGKRPQSPATLPPLPPRPRWPTEDERKQAFLDDEDVSKIEPHRLLCKICNCWIRLHPVVRYSQSVWPKHKAACKEATLQTSPGDARVRAKTEKEDKRRQMLEEDPYVTDITPHRVTCNACGTNIRLDTTYKYEGSHWRAHRARCAQIPFHERAAKKRKQEGRRPSQTYDGGRGQDSPTGESSDSYDSDASSAPRPRPMAFFTAPLEIDPTKMFSSRTRSIQLRNHIAKDSATKTENPDVLLYLHKIADDLTESGRLSEIINSAGDARTPISPETDSSEDQIPSPDTVYSVIRSEHSEPEPKPPASPYLDIPRVKDSETADAFDEFFKSLTYGPQQGLSNIRACTLDRDSLPIMD